MTQQYVTPANQLERTDYQLTQAKGKVNEFLSRPTEDNLKDVIVYLERYKTASEQGVFILPMFS